MEGAASRGCCCWLEARGRSLHPAYSGVTLRPGFRPWTRTPSCSATWRAPTEIEGYPGHPLPSLPELVELHERDLPARVRKASVAAIALNTRELDDDAGARWRSKQTEAETGLPADDPVRFGPATPARRRSCPAARLAPGESPGQTNAAGGKPGARRAGEREDVRRRARAAHAAARLNRRGDLERPADERQSTHSRAFEHPLRIIRQAALRGLKTLTHRVGTVQSVAGREHREQRVSAERSYASSCCAIAPRSRYNAGDASRTSRSALTVGHQQPSDQQEHSANWPLTLSGSTTRRALAVGIVGTDTLPNVGAGRYLAPARVRYGRASAPNSSRPSLFLFPSVRFGLPLRLGNRTSARARISRLEEQTFVHIAGCKHRSASRCFWVRNELATLRPYGSKLRMRGRHNDGWLASRPRGSRHQGWTTHFAALTEDVQQPRRQAYRDHTDLPVVRPAADQRIADRVDATGGRARTLAQRRAEQSTTRAFSQMQTTRTFVVTATRD